MQGCTEKVDAVTASERLVSHAFLHLIDMGPGWSGWPGQADTFSAVAQAGESFIGEALVRGAAIRAGMAEAARRHVPAIQKRARGHGTVPGETRHPAGGPAPIDPL